MESNPFEPPQTQPLAPREKKKKFALSRSNKLLLIAASLQVVIHVITLDDSDYAIGATIGILARIVLVSYLIARLSWWILKNSKVASAVFNTSLIVLTLVQMVSAQIRVDRTTKDEAVKIIEKEFAIYTAVAENSEDSAEITIAFNKLVEALNSHSQQNPNAAYTLALEFFAIINERHVAVANALPEWRKAFAAALESHVLDPIHLTTEAEFSSQEATIQAYLHESKMLPSKDSLSFKKFVERIMEIEPKNVFAKAAVSKWSPDPTVEASPLEEFATIHIKHAEAMLGMIQLLHEHIGEWYYEDDQLYLPGDAILEEYNRLSQLMAESRELIFNAEEEMK